MTPTLLGVVQCQVLNKKRTCPTKDISPQRIQNNSGSSSKELARSRLPKVPRRCESGNRTPLAFRSSVIDRNFNIRKDRLARPGRSWAKRTGVPSFSRTHIATKAVTGSQTGAPIIRTERSSHRFIRGKRFVHPYRPHRVHRGGEGNCIGAGFAFTFGGPFSSVHLLRLHLSQPSADTLMVPP